MRTPIQRFGERARRGDPGSIGRREYKSELPAIWFSEFAAHTSNALQVICVRDMRSHLCDIFDGDLGRAVGAEQAVRFLEGIGELGVAETAEKRQL